MSGSRQSMFGNTRPSTGDRARSVGKWALVAVVILAVVGVATGLYLLNYASSEIVREDLPALTEQEPALDAEGNEIETEGLNVLVVGTDSRERLSAEQLAELGTTDEGTSLTDTVMLVQVHPGREKAVVVSFPRDLKVEVPGHGDRKINAVHGLGGANLLVEVIEDYTGVQIDHYAEVDLAGFIDLVDAVGGVEICLEQSMVDAYAGVNLPAGCQQLNSAQSAGFVRSRRVADEFGPADDFGRIARQQYFVKQVTKQVTERGTLFNPFKLKSLIDAVADAVIVDAGLGPRQLLNLATSLRELDPEQVDFRVVPGFWSPQTGYVHAYPEETAALMQALQLGEALPGDFGQEPTEDLTPESVRVLVLNGEGSEGLASLVADKLEAGGFVVAGTENNDTFDIPVTIIRTTPADEPRARLLLDLIPGAQLEVVPRLSFTNVHVVLVVGADRAGVAPKDGQDT